ncbi:hypothetical protein DdX_19958 [Ditylenchus destructor]|uniref:Uncharacterized protein n=1 Tax=Ditylenchus destructor TaxID=166010 RepID=A0AAD4MHZ5_9BILA|nr:hypothetical protein DdX_19958 [Ditylenchus destructor]
MKFSLSFAIVFISLFIAQSFVTKKELPEFPDATVTRTPHVTNQHNTNGSVQQFHKWIAKYQPVKPDGPIYEGEVIKDYAYARRFGDNDPIFYVRLNNGEEYSVAKSRVNENDFITYYP